MPESIGGVFLVLIFIAIRLAVNMPGKNAFTNTDKELKVQRTAALNGHGSAIVATLFKAVWPRAM